jgi:hypothetical protein
MTASRVVAKTRKRNTKPEQLVLFKKRGGKRRGAGRPPKGKRAGAPHKARPFLNERYPVHVVLRVVPAVGNLRRRCAYQAIRGPRWQVAQPASARSKIARPRATSTGSVVGGIKGAWGVGIQVAALLVVDGVPVVLHAGALRASPSPRGSSSATWDATRPGVDALRLAVGR